MRTLEALSCTSKHGRKILSVSKQYYSCMLDDTLNIVHCTGSAQFIVRVSCIEMTYLFAIVAFFVELLNRSRQNLEDSFGHSYGHDSQMFASLYRDLKSYYKVCSEGRSILFLFFGRSALHTAEIVYTGLERPRKIH